MKTSVWLLAVVLACGLAGTAMSVENSSTEGLQRTVQGTVIAVNVDADPQIIVVEVMLPNDVELIVGARVSTDTTIKNGKEAALLADIQVGEKVNITYLKTSIGLIAQSIQVR
ncbi:MAG: hypothetical protein KF876_09835 [Nitrospira sp.]|nr:hypothetical protein [Nitrospira sp.]